MAEEAVKITRYPNRRFYDHNASSYVSLEEIEELVTTGKSIEVRDSQTGDDLTRVVLARIIMERQPDKMQLFPIDMLHFMVRSNTVMSDFLRDYFRHALPYLDYLQRHSTAAVSTLIQPVHWIKAWLDSIVPTKRCAINHRPKMLPRRKQPNLWPNESRNSKSDCANWKLRIWRKAPAVLKLIDR